MGHSGEASSGKAVDVLNSSLQRDRGVSPMGELSVRNRFLIAFGTLVTGFQSLFIFVYALAGSLNTYESLWVQTALSAGLGILLAVLWDHRKSIDKIQIILIPPGGLMALMLWGTTQAISSGSLSVTSGFSFLLIPLAIGLPAILIPMLVARYKHKESSSNSQEEMPLSYFESKILAENSRRPEGLDEDRLEAAISADDKKDRPV